LDRLVIMTSDSEVNERLLECLRVLFPECAIDIVLRGRENSPNVSEDAELKC
jgi:hypothetical protein